MYKRSPSRTGDAAGSRRARAWFKRPRPDHVPFQIETVEPKVAEIGVHPLAIGHRRLEAKRYSSGEWGCSRALVRIAPRGSRRTRIEANHLDSPHAPGLRPVAAEIQTLLGCSNSPLFTAVVTNTRSAHTIGEDQPRPGRSVFQAMFSPAEPADGQRRSAGDPAALGRGTRASAPPLGSRGERVETTQQGDKRERRRHRCRAVGLRHASFLRCRACYCRGGWSTAASSVSAPSVRWRQGVRIRSQHRTRCGRTRSVDHRTVSGIGGRTTSWQPALKRIARFGKAAASWAAPRA